MRRLGALFAALLLAFLVAPPYAGAIEPPIIDPAAIPPDETGPDQPMEQSRVCAAPTVFPNSNFADRPWANDYLRLAREFHTVILGNGALPLDVLEAQVDAWIAEKKASA